MTDTPNDATSVPPAALSLHPSGSLVYDGIVVGTYYNNGATNPDAPEPQRDVLELNLGWLRAAGLGIRVLDDPTVDRHRGGVTLER